MSANLIAPYAEAHKNPQGPGDARPTAMQIIQDEDLVNKWTDKTVLITGGSSGIGIETARAMHATGADVFITSRNLEAADAVRTEILARSPGKGRFEIIFMELDSLLSVRRGVADFASKSDKLNVLINNAGVLAVTKRRTKDGFETTFGVNHLAHFLLTKLLLPTLVASSSSGFNSRVVNVSSTGHRHQPGGLTPEVFDDLFFEKTPYQKWLAYGRSKVANILHVNQIERLYGSGDHPVHGFSLMPGGISTKLWRHLGDAHISNLEKTRHNYWKSPEQGAATTVWCAVAKVWEGRPGRYCDNCQEAAPLSEEDALNMDLLGHAPWAYDQAAEERLWELSERAVAW